MVTATALTTGRRHALVGTLGRRAEHVRAEAAAPQVHRRARARGAVVVEALDEYGAHREAVVAGRQRRVARVACAARGVRYVTHLRAVGQQY